MKGQPSTIKGWLHYYLRTWAQQWRDGAVPRRQLPDGQPYPAPPTGGKASW